ncbi:MAG TPA: PH domain-containing protein [Flavobacterium sp.]
MKFSATMDRTTKVVTILLIGALLIIPLSILIVRKEGESFGPVVMPVIMLIVLGVIVEYRVLYYQVTDEEIIIRRSAGNAVIKRSEIKSINMIESDQLRKSIRTFGVGGLFGYFGSFYNRRLGAMTWYLTRRDKLVLITTATGKKIVISPDDPEGLVAAAKLT